MRTMGWRYPFRQQPWPDLDAEYSALAEENPAFAYLSDIVKSVRSCGMEDHLAAFTSLRDLMVVAQPIPEVPYDLVAVRSIVSTNPAPRGQVLIEHLAVTGKNDRIERPVSEAVALFWRFMIEKFGVDPNIVSPTR